MDFAAFIGTLWSKLVEHLEKVLPAEVFEFFIAQLPMPLDD